MTKEMWQKVVVSEIPTTVAEIAAWEGVKTDFLETACVYGLDGSLYARNTFCITARELLRQIDKAKDCGAEIGISDDEDTIVIKGRRKDGMSYETTYRRVRPAKSEE